MNKDRRARIEAMSPESRATLAEIMRKQLDEIPAQIAKLQDEAKALTAWLEEFGQ